DGLYVEAEQIMHAAGGTARPIARLGQIGSLRGVHNAQNAACAAGAALALGVSSAIIQEGLRSFPGLPHRMEEVGRKGRVLFIKTPTPPSGVPAAGASACSPAFFGLPGGRPKTGGSASLTAFSPRMPRPYLTGKAAAAFAAELDGRVPHVVAGTLDRAVALA